MYELTKPPQLQIEDPPKTTYYVPPSPPTSPYSKRNFVITLVALAAVGTMVGLAVSHPDLALYLFGGGIAAGIGLALMKRIASKAFGYKDRSLLQLVHSKVGNGGLWGGAAAGVAGSFAIDPMFSFAGAGVLSGEVAAKHTLDLVGDLPYHIKGLASFIKTFHKEYPNGWKYLLGTAAVLVGLAVFTYVMPGTGITTIGDLKIPTKLLEIVGGLVLGLVGVGTARLLIASKTNNKDHGALRSWWKDAAAKERIGKVAVWIGSAALFATAATMMFSLHSHIGLAYAIMGASASGVLWVWFPSLPPRSARVAKTVGKGITYPITYPIRKIYELCKPLPPQPDS